MATREGEEAQQEAAAAAGAARPTRCVRPGKEKRAAELSANVLAPFATARDAGRPLRRWDGASGTWQEHRDWILAHAREFCAADKAGFRTTGERDGITYATHDEMTALGGGDGYFRLSGTVGIPPELLVALVMDAESLLAMDETVMLMDLGVEQFSDKRTALGLWVAAPGFPFKWRDGLDLSTYTRDADGVLWQAAVSLPDEMAADDDSIRAVDRYWAYRLEPLDGGARTALTLVCQTSLNGWMPRPLVNMMVPKVLADYVRTVETLGRKMQASGEAKALIEGLTLP